MCRFEMFGVWREKNPGQIMAGRISTDQNSGRTIDRAYKRGVAFAVTTFILRYGGTARYYRAQITANKTCHGHDVKAQKTDKSFSCKRFETASV